ncbi:hypothetical protein C9I89_20910 [Photobacterium lipolyticum]|uniref:Uncharacterized protein n=1 Tax=Photobacterium lipolyticum TaxID=266810 RepID=A0A2T3MSC4_9GAMM|nr:hypothetical protein C9I89_20910 [Photobacterium lipolyticum]
MLKHDATLLNYSAFMCSSLNKCCLVNDLLLYRPPCGLDSLFIINQHEFSFTSMLLMNKNWASVHMGYGKMLPDVRYTFYFFIGTNAYLIN